MKYRTRIYYTEQQKSLMWDRWQKGESLSSIARLFDRHHSSVEGILKATGGIRARLRRRSRLALTLSEREEISRGVAAGYSSRSNAGSRTVDSQSRDPAQRRPAPIPGQPGRSSGLGAGAPPEDV